MYSRVHSLTLGESSATVADNSSHPIADVQHSAWRPLYTKNPSNAAEDPRVASFSWYVLYCNALHWHGEHVITHKIIPAVRQTPHYGAPV